MMFWRKKKSKEPETMSEVAMEPAAPEAKISERPIAPSQPVIIEDAAVEEIVPVDEPVTVVASSEIDVAVAQFEGKVIEAISTVFDPEIPVNIYELGLIYNIDINGMNDVNIDMTLTSPACPVAGTLPGDVERVVQGVEGVGGVHVELVWDPAWSPDRMSEAAKLELGFM